MSATATVMIVRPRKDNDPTAVTYLWGEKSVEIAKDMGYEVIDIQKDDVTYDNVTNKIKEYRPKLFVAFSHGCPGSLQGSNGCYLTRRFGTDEIQCMIESGDPEKIEVVRKMVNPMGGISCPGICKLNSDPCGLSCQHPTNINELRGAIVFATACYSGRQLGKCADRFGVECYGGQDELYLFPVDDLGSENMFRDIQLTFIKSLLMGKTVDEAERDMSEFEDNLISKYKKTKWIALPMLFNKVHRKIHGNRYAMIYDLLTK